MLRVIAVLVAAFLACATSVSAAFYPTSAYERVKVFEWTVLISPSLNAQPRLKAQMMRNLEAQLAFLRANVRPEALKQIVKPDIWMEVTTKGDDAHHIVGQFFPSRRWLLHKGMNPDKLRDVQLNALFAKDGPKGTVLFHELAHFYHDKKMRGSNKIQRLWEAAWLANPKAVDKCRVRRQAYAFRNPGEFFATYSQAYLARTCAFPYDRATLRKIDPDTYALLQRIWGAAR